MGEYEFPRYHPAYVGFEEMKIRGCCMRNNPLFLFSFSHIRQRSAAVPSLPLVGQEQDDNAD